MSAHRRIIDANLNRAREALRVLEEYARFVVGDASLSRAIKQTRHDLAAAPGDALAAGLLAFRDVRGDVGRDVETGDEYRRDDAASVARAAGKRAGEALRVIEEYGKVIDAAFARRVEAVRYETYDLERRLWRTVSARARFDSVRLYVLLTPSRSGCDALDLAGAVLDGGADAVQLRDKEGPDRERLARARRLAELCHARDALFIVNDRPDIAALAGADGVHVGQEDVTVRDARRVAGPDRIVGVSTHTVDQARAVIDDAPDYIAVGPMFDSRTKPQPRIAGPETLSAVRALTALPLVAIGGIDASNARSVLGAARCALCVGGAIIEAEEPAAAARAVRAAIDALDAGGPRDD